MAPMTRMRGTKLSDGIWVPNDLTAKYYAQRSTRGGLLISEGLPISRSASGYPGVPGLFTPSQIHGWHNVTSAVHYNGGYIYAQLCHVGRTAGPSISGTDPVGPTSERLTSTAPDGSSYASNPVHALTIPEIEDVVQDFANAAKQAINAGFDGIEIHGANGYLIDQFIHDDREDAYGGSIANRARLPLGVLEAVTAVIGAERVGIRLSPFNRAQEARDSDPTTHWAYLCEEIAKLPSYRRPVYVHMVEARYDRLMTEEEKMAALADAATTQTFSLDPFRLILQEAGITFLASGNYNRESAAGKVERGEADMVAFGRLFLANPDLPEKLKDGLEMNAYDRSTFYEPTIHPPEKGYVDYPFHGKQHEAF